MPLTSSSSNSFLLDFLISFKYNLFVLWLYGLTGTVAVAVLSYSPTVQALIASTM